MKQQWAHNLHTQNTYNLSSSDNTMPSRKSPRKNQGMQPGYYGHTNQDSPVIARGKASAKPPAKKRSKIGYKLPRKKLQAPPRKNYTKSSSDSLEYEDDSESDDEDNGQMIDVSNKKRNMVATISKRGRQGEQKTNDEVDIDDVDSEKGTPELPITKLRKSIFNDEDDDDDEEKDDYDDGDRGTSWMNERRKKDNEIAMLKRKINELESTIKNMQSTSMVTGRDKAGWTGDEVMFVKDINDFCRERLYPKEKFLRKNWVEYLPNDRRSLYSVCMKHLSIPEGSNPKEIWGRVIVPSIRDKYQSMKCNMNNKIKSIYLSMRFLLEFAHTLLIVVAFTNRVCYND